MMNNQKQRFTQLIKRKISDGVEHGFSVRGESLPCTVQEVIDKGLQVKVKIEISDIQYPIITIPVMASEYFRLPVKAGDKGLAIPCNYYLGGITDNGGGTASSFMANNLNDLVFIPVSSIKWDKGDNRYITALVKISDNAYLINPTRIWNKCVTIINYIITIKDKLNDVILVVNAHTGSNILPITDVISSTTDNLAEEYQE